MVQGGIACNQFSEEFYRHPCVVDGFIPAHRKCFCDRRLIFALDFFCPRFVALRTEAHPADQRSVGLLDTVGADGRLKSLTIALVAQFDFLARALAYDFHPLLPSLDVLSIGTDQLVAFFQTGFFSRAVFCHFADTGGDFKRRQPDIALVFRNFTCFGRAGGIDNPHGFLPRGRLNGNIYLA